MDRYTFDDLSIGLMEKDGRSLHTRLVRRPATLSMDSWYKFAGEIVNLLNEERNGHS